MYTCFLCRHISSSTFPLSLSLTSHLIPSFLFVSLHPYISLTTVPLRCCQSWHLPFKCQQTPAICLYLSTKYRCMHLQAHKLFVCVCVLMCAPSIICIHVFVCPFLCMRVRFNGKRWCSQQPKQALAHGGSTHYLSSCLKKRKNEANRGNICVWEEVRSVCGGWSFII